MGTVWFTRLRHLGHDRHRWLTPARRGSHSWELRTQGLAGPEVLGREEQEASLFSHWPRALPRGLVLCCEQAEKTMFMLPEGQEPDAAFPGARAGYPS